MGSNYNTQERTQGVIYAPRQRNLTPNYDASAALIKDPRAVMLGDAQDLGSVLDVAEQLRAQRFYVHSSCLDDELCVILIKGEQASRKRYHVGLRDLDLYDQASAINTLMDKLSFGGFRPNDQG